MNFPQTPTPLRRHRNRLGATSLALALAGALAFGAAQAGPHGGHGDMGGPMMMGSGKHMTRMLDAVDATAEQRSQIQSISEAARSDLRARRAEGKALQEQAIRLFAQPTVDAGEAEALRQQMLARHDEGSKRMMQAMLDISRVLSPEQRQKLGSMMAERQARMQARVREHAERKPERQ